MAAEGFRCPICRKPISKSAGTFPFCSRRCRLVDLGEWFSGGYTISRPIGPTDDWEPEEAEGPGET